MIKTVVLLMLMLITVDVRASVIDIVEKADGSFEIFSDGERYGAASSRASAQKVADKLGRGGNTINWKKAPSGAGTTMGNGSQKSLSGASQSKTLPAASQQKALPAAAQPKALPAASQPKALPAAAQPKALPAHVEPTPKPVPGPKVNVGGAALGAIGVVSGAMGLYEDYKAKDTKATWSDVGTGAMAGATFAAGGAAIVNAIPVGGQIAYGAAVAVGVVVGASRSGARMFSETDCEIDPVTEQYACCNVSDLTDLKNARRCNIGDEMFAEFPYVRTCMQGDNKVESNWFVARFLDDHWSDKGEVKFCSGYEMPTNGEYNIQRYGSSEANGKVCWKWECADAGMVRRGNKCIAADAGESKSNQAAAITLDPIVISGSIRAGDPCPTDRLPQYATAGVYIKNGKNKDTGLDKFVCAATQCQSGTYLVKNDAGQSQGWCRAGNALDKPVTGVLVPDDENVTAPTEADNQPLASNESKTSPVVVSNNCESGIAGYVMYNGVCITTDQMSDIQRAAADAQRRVSTQNISDAYKKIRNMAENFDKSVWKNKDGKFNTSRLVSDSVAGVVLGTAGGLITSNVIKKNQLKNGFEDIKCVVGGQVVAEFGDMFSVGIK